MSAEKQLSRHTNIDKLAATVAANLPPTRAWRGSVPRLRSAGVSAHSTVAPLAALASATVAAGQVAAPGARPITRRTSPPCAFWPNEGP